MFVSFKIDGQVYALPLENVECALRMVALTPLPEAPPWLAGVVNLQGRVIPAIDLRRRLEQPAKKPRIDDRLLIVKDRRRRMALIVDEATEVLEIKSHLLESPDPMPRSGPLAAVIQRDEDLVMILDVDRLMPSEGKDAYFGLPMEKVKDQKTEK